MSYKSRNVGAFLGTAALWRDTYKDNVKVFWKQVALKLMTLKGESVRLKKVHRQESPHC